MNKSIWLIKKQIKPLTIHFVLMLFATEMYARIIPNLLEFRYLEHIIGHLEMQIWYSVVRSAKGKVDNKYCHLCFIIHMHFYIFLIKVIVLIKFPNSKSI